jgi:hypothetical protein
MQFLQLLLFYFLLRHWICTVREVAGRVKNDNMLKELLNVVQHSHLLLAAVNVDAPLGPERYPLNNASAEPGSGCHFILGAVGPRMFSLFRLSNKVSQSVLMDHYIWWGC